MDDPDQLGGIITVLNTPLTNEDIVDLGALEQHVKYAADAGVSGFVLPAMASEVHKLSPKERIRMVEVVLAATGDTFPVFVGTADPDPLQRKRLLKSYLQLGCTHVLVQLPFEDVSTFKRHFLELADFGPEMIMLQDWSASGYGLPDELIVELFEEVESFQCLKVETVPAGLKYSRILELTAGELHLSGGWAVNQMMEGLRRGVHAFMPTAMHYVYTEIYRTFMDGNEDEAQRLFEQILPVLAFSNQHLDISIHFFKRLLFRQNVYPTPRVRQPALPFDEVHKEIADDLTARVIRLEEEIKSRRPDTHVGC